MRNWKLFGRSLFLLLITVMLFCASCGKNKAATIKLIKTDGEVRVENEKGKAVDLINNLGLYNGYGIGTQAESFAWINLDDTKFTKMDEKSDVDIIKDGKKLELTVNSGSLFFNVKKPLEDDESMDIRTSTTICGIRGTCGWVESQGDISYVSLLDGKVECSVTVDGKEETVTVKAKELLIVTKDDGHVTYEVRELTYSDVPEFVLVEIEGELVIVIEELKEKSSATAKDFEGAYTNQNTGVSLEISPLDDIRAQVSWRGVGNSISVPPDTPIFPDPLAEAVIDGKMMIADVHAFDETENGKYTLALLGDQIIVTVLEPFQSEIAADTYGADINTAIDAAICGTYIRD